MTLKSYDFVKSTSIDYMHGVLLGIGKLLINLWISSTHSKEIFSISNYVEIIGQRLKLDHHLLSQEFRDHCLTILNIGRPQN